MYPYKSLSSGPSFYRSITTALGAVPGAVADKLLFMMELYRQRRALERLDDRMLKDIGVSRCEVEQELARSYWR